MTQVEFEDKLREMKSQKRMVQNQIALMQAELKEEISQKSRQLGELFEQLSKLKMQRAGLHERYIKAEMEWGGKIRKFINDYHDSVEREWDSISTYTIVRQLRKRGWQGTIFNNDPDMAEEHKEGVIAVFSGKFKEEQKDEETE